VIHEEAILQNGLNNPGRSSAFADDQGHHVAAQPTRGKRAGRGGGGWKEETKCLTRVPPSGARRPCSSDTSLHTLIVSGSVVRLPH
jgi:hypothetical protein